NASSAANTTTAASEPARGASEATNRRTNRDGEFGLFTWGSDFTHASEARAALVAAMAKRRLADRVLEALPILDSKRRRKERKTTRLILPSIPARACLRLLSTATLWLDGDAPRQPPNRHR